MLRFFRGLRGKLILTYTLVTVLALLALEGLVLLVILGISTFMRTDERAYLNDVIYTLYPQASAYLQPGKEDLPGLQGWLEQVYASGRASLDPQNLFDSPAAFIVKREPIYVLSPDGTVLAQAPSGSSSLVGRAYTPPDVNGSQAILDRARDANFNSLLLYTRTPQGKYLMMFPITQDKLSSPLVGILVLTIQPAPVFNWSVWAAVFGWILFTAVLLLMAVTPFGALFGLVMSGGLTRRLARLTAAADAWSEGNFVALPPDRSKDEISYLGMRMRNMAERVQSLLQSRQELAMLEERNRLARELHDTIKQQTFATLMQVRAARNLISSDPEAADQRLAEAEDLIKTSQQEMGRVITELRPAALEGQGLSGALEEYLNNWSQYAHIPSTLEITNERRLPFEIEQALYRVAQEALSNVSRHSRASAVTVHLDFAPEKICMSISDNGTGFNASDNQKPGFGLQSMHERMEALGGFLVVESTGGNGTNVMAEAPLSSPRRVP